MGHEHLVVDTGQDPSDHEAPSVVARKVPPVMGTIRRPYHSTNPSDPDVYHDHDSCPSGQQIPWRNARPGRGKPALQALP